MRDRRMGKARTQTGPQGIVAVEVVLEDVTCAAAVTGDGARGQPGEFVEQLAAALGRDLLVAAVQQLVQWIDGAGGVQDLQQRLAGDLRLMPDHGERAVDPVQIPALQQLGPLGDVGAGTGRGEQVRREREGRIGIARMPAQRRQIGLGDGAALVRTASEATTGNTWRPSSRPYCSAARTASAHRAPTASALFSTTMVRSGGSEPMMRASAGPGAAAST